MKKSFKAVAIPFAALSITAAAALTAHAGGWELRDGDTWVYAENDGTLAEDKILKDGDHSYYVNNDGEMVRDELVEYNDNFYYFNEDGAMVTDEWRSFENTDGGEDEPDTLWYYFQSNGRAVKQGSSEKVKFRTLKTADGDAKFAFNEDGHMLTGWIGEDGEALTGDEAWKDGIYYLGSDGRQANGWVYLDTEGDDDHPDKEGSGNWFYFGTNGKKTSDKDNKTINGQKYSFNIYGAAEFDWYQTPKLGTASGAKYYNSEDSCALSSGWFKAVPAASVDAEAHENGEEHWFYTKSNGELITAQIKNINGKKYGFDTNGEMLSGLYKIVFDEDGKTISEAIKIESLDEMPDEEDEGVKVFYFGEESGEGVMATGSTKISLDGENVNFYFEKSGTKAGSGVNGANDGSLYVQGRRLEAEEGTRYQAVSFGENDYLVNTSGKLQKNKKNLKDADGTYFCTDARGIITYQGDDKQEK